MSEDQVMQKQEQDAAHAAELIHAEDLHAAEPESGLVEGAARTPLHKLKKGKFGSRIECHEIGMQERVLIGQQFAVEIKWVMLAKQLRNQHILPFFSLEKWMYNGHRFDLQLFY